MIRTQSVLAHFLEHSQNLQASHRGSKPPPQNALCKPLAAEPIAASSLPLGRQGFLVHPDGSLMEEDPASVAFLLEGVPMNLALAEALMINSRCVLKDLFLRELDDATRRFMNYLVEYWLSDVMGQTLCAEPPAQGGQLATSAPSKSKHAVEREAFDTTAAAFVFFRDNPDVFGRQADDHTRNVSVTTDVFRKVFEVAISGPWQQPCEELEICGPPVPEVKMPLETVNELLDECCVAWKLRQVRNSTIAHCWSGGPIQHRQRLLGLLESALTARHALVRDVARLTAAAVQHLHDMLQEEAKQAKKVAPPFPLV